MNVELALIAMAPDFTDRTNPKFLVHRLPISNKYSLPVSNDLNAKSCEEIADDLLLKYTGISTSKWSAIKLRNASWLNDRQRNLIVVTVSTVIPPDTECQNDACLIGIRELITQDIFPYHLEVLRQWSAR